MLKHFTIRLSVVNKRQKRIPSPYPNSKMMFWRCLHFKSVFQLNKLTIPIMKLMSVELQCITIPADGLPFTTTYDLNNCGLDGAINPLPSLTLQSARDLSVPCRPNRSKALVLVCKLNACWKKTRSFCPCSRALNRSDKGLIKKQTYSLYPKLWGIWP
jgi:hypothetical protein